MVTKPLLGSNINLVKMHNRQAILLSLLHEQSLSRVQLARRTSLSTTTITNLINEMLAQGLVVEEGELLSGEKRSVGRPRTALRLVPEARYAVGVHIGIGLFRVGLTDLYAQLLHSKIKEFSIAEPPENVLEAIGRTINELLENSAVPRQRVLGVGVGASGLVDYQHGLNVLAPNLGWRNLPIRTMVSRQVNLPVAVDNNVRCMALGEAFFGAGRQVDSLAFVYGRIGVGAGFVFNGQVFRGAAAGAGEIGHMLMQLDQGEICRCGQRGCLETLVSEPVLLRQAEMLARREPGGILARALSTAENDQPTIERVFTAARQGDDSAQQLIEQRATYLGMALANLVNALNPQLIILGGMFAQGADLFLPIVERVLRQCAFAGLGEAVQMQPTTFGWRAGVIGAAALALASFFYQTEPSPGPAMAVN